MTHITEAWIYPVQSRDVDSGEPIDVVHADDCRKIEEDLADAYRYILHLSIRKDGACSHCYPYSTPEEDGIIPGFTCAYHKALTYWRASIANGESVAPRDIANLL